MEISRFMFNKSQINKLQIIFTCALYFFGGKISKTEHQDDDDDEIAICDFKCNFYFSH